MSCGNFDLTDARVTEPFRIMSPKSAARVPMLSRANVLNSIIIMTGTMMMSMNM